MATTKKPVKKAVKKVAKKPAPKKAVKKVAAKKPVKKVQLKNIVRAAATGTDEEGRRPAPTSWFAFPVFANFVCGTPRCRFTATQHP